VKFRSHSPENLEKFNSELVIALSNFDIFDRFDIVDRFEIYNNILFDLYNEFFQLKIKLYP